MGIVFFILTVLVLPGLPSGGVEPRWAFLSLVAGRLLFDIEIAPLTWLLILYVGLMAWFAPIHYDAAYLYWHFFILVALFLYARHMDIRRIAIGCGLGFAVNSVAVIAQARGWDFIPQMFSANHIYGGFYYNPAAGSEAAAIAAALIVGERLYWLLPGLVPTLLYGTRGPIAALGLTSMVFLWKRSPFVGLVAALAALLIVVMWMNKPYDTLGFRFDVWWDALSGLTFFGQGLGSWISEFPRYQVHSNALNIRYENAHNDFLQIIFELGVGGAILLGIFLYAFWRAPRTGPWYALLVALVVGCFSFPLYNPVSGALMAVLAGHLLGRGDPVRLVQLGKRCRIWGRNAQARFAALYAGFSAFSDPSQPSLGGGILRDPDERYGPGGVGQRGAGL